MSIYKRKLICSSETFNGYEIIIDIRYYSNFDELINHFKNELLKTLTENNFEILIEIFEKSNFHIHTHNFEEILLEDSKPIYICDAC
jgi:hypothetical protein